jgi:hypothetical protein
MQIQCYDLNINSFLKEFFFNNFTKQQQMVYIAVLK